MISIWHPVTLTLPSSWSGRIIVQLYQVFFKFGNLSEISQFMQIRPSKLVQVISTIAHIHQKNLPRINNVWIYLDVRIIHAICHLPVWVFHISDWGRDILRLKTYIMSSIFELHTCQTAVMSNWRHFLSDWRRVEVMGATPPPPTLQKTMPGI